MKRTLKLKKLLLAANQNPKEKKYWMEQLSGEWEKSFFPYDHKKTSNRHSMSEVKFCISGELYSKLIALCKNSDLKLHVITAAALAALLNKYTGNEDIVIGTPIYKQKTTGDFINTVIVLRNQIDGNITFKDLILNMKEVILKAVENRNYPVEILSDQLNMPFTENDDFPLFDIAVLMESIHDKHYLQDINCNTIFSFSRTGQYIEGKLEYNISLYNKTTIQRIIDHFTHLLQEAVFNVEVKLRDISALSKKDRHRLLFEFNNTKKRLVRDKGYHQLFEEAVSKDPGRPAAIYKDQQITYNELNKEADSIAQSLLKKGVTANTVTALYLKRSINMLASIIGVFKAGGAYLPLEPDWPGTRIEYILENSEVDIVITDAGHLETLQGIQAASPGFKVVLCREPGEILVNPVQGNPGKTPGGNFHPDNLAYMIYTSGTTGKPKGVLIHQLGMINHLYAKINDLSIAADDIIAQTASAGFDISVWQFLAALLMGGKTLIINKEILLESRDFLQVLQREQVTILEFVPSFIAAFLETTASGRGSKKTLNCLRWMLLTGEPLGVPMARAWYRRYPSIKLVNAYGPTEAADDVTHYILEEESLAGQSTIPVGKPLQNLHIYILDKNLSLCPIGVRGEICVAGLGVGKGYWRDIDRTKNSFIPNPYIEEIGDVDFALLYKTGDIGYFREDGNIECLGRLDYQVKIRGNRIELGEIENQLLTHKDIKQAVVVVTSGENRELCAYIVAYTGKEIDIAGLREYLQGELPGYMIPAHFVQIDKIPLTSNGKIDRKTLPSPGAAGSPRETFVPPQDEIQYKLTELWSEILGIEKEMISIDNNFFQMGGHSLRATILISRIHKELNVKLPLVEIFKTQTIRRLSGCIKEAAKDRYKSIEPTAKKEYYPLSSTQKRLYFLQQMDKNSTAYNLLQTVLMEGEPHKEKLETILKKLIERHESLRTSFEMVSGVPVQRIHHNPGFTIGYFQAHDQDTGPAVEKIIHHFIKPFDLTHVPLMRVGLIEISKTVHIFMSDIHHIVSDGVSHTLLMKDFMSLYKGEDLPLLRLRYRDFSEWKNSHEQKEMVKLQKEYWLREFEGDDIPVLNIPTDFKRPPVQDFEGSTLGFDIGSEEASGLKELAIKEGTTLYTILLTVFNILLAKLGGQEDIVIGSPLAGRRHAELQKIIGIFINTLALRNYPASEKKYIDFLRSVKKNVLKALENQDYPFDELVEQAAVTRDISRNPLFDVVLVLQNMDFPGIEIPGLKISPYEYNTRYSKFDLTLQAMEIGDKLVFSFEYCTKLFTKKSIEAFTAYFKKIVSSILNDIEQKISGIEIIPGEEKKQLLFDFNNTKAGYPHNKTIHELFAQQAEKTPDHAALAAINEKHEKNYNMSYLPSMSYISYNQLNEKSGQLAFGLKEKGLQPDTIAGIMIEKSIEMIIGLLGILKAGAAYLPIDPQYPPERINFILADSNANILLVVSETRAKVKAGIEENPRQPQHLSVQLIDIETEPASAFEPSLSTSTLTSTCQVSPTNLAYIIYTSGTTGQPKGVLIEHRNVVRLMLNDKFPFDFNSRDTWTMFHSCCFDFSVWEMYGALLYGGKLILIPGIIARNPKRYLEILKAEGVTVLNQTPKAFYNIADEELNCRDKRLELRYIIFGGEALDPARLNKWKEKYPSVTLVNMYGITETTVHVTYKEIGKADIRLNVSNIGSPIPTLNTYIMDKNLKLLPIGIAGEICIGGDGVARGYLNRVSLIGEKFIENPYIPGEILYKSGDLAKLSRNGEMEYLGRIDQQVKIRGYRVELGEIEHRLIEHPGIIEAVVTIQEYENGDKYLCSYVIVHANLVNTLRLSDMRDHLAGFLPHYMIPAYFVTLENFPLTANGKIDRKALPSPGVIELGSDSEYVEPGNAVEEKLVEIWETVLLIDDIGINDNFFEIGGDSLRAMTVLSKIQKKLDVKVPIVEFFKGPTIKCLADYIKKIENREEFVPIKAAESKEYYVLSSVQRRLYFLQELDKNSTGYNLTYTILLEGQINRSKFEVTFRRVIKRHETLRTSIKIAADEPVQFIHDDAAFEIEYYTAGEDEVKEIILGHIVRPFDLGTPPFFRTALLEISTEKYILVVNMHHIITDGVSFNIFVNDFISLYGDTDLPPLPLQYKDYSEWQNSQAQTESTALQETYWLQEFEQDIPVLDIPADFPRPEKRNYKGDMLYFDLGRELSRKLVKLAKETETTQYMILLSVYNILLSKYTRREDIVVGSPIPGRRHIDLQKIMGMFVNMLAVRNRPGANKTYREFLMEVRAAVLKALENQDYQFNELVIKLGLQGNINRNPLFDTVFEMRFRDNTGTGSHYPQDYLKVSQYDPGIKESVFDLILWASESDDLIEMILTYSTALFKRTRAEKMSKHYIEILNQVVENTDIKLGDIRVSHGLVAIKSNSSHDGQGDFQF